MLLIGGYWEIFLGYALITLPQVAAKWMKTMKSLMEKDKDCGMSAEN